MQPAPLLNLLRAYANRLKFRNLFILTVVLFVIDLLIPDFIPMIDEIILALLTVILANWKKPAIPEQAGRIIEGEALEHDESNH